MNIKYVAFYDAGNSGRNISSAAVNKIEYIRSAFQRTGFSVDIISPAWRIRRTKDDASAHLRQDDVKFPPSLGYIGPMSSLINVIVVNFWLLYIFLMKSKRGEKILIYHSLAILPAVLFARLTGSIKVVLEVEEIYTKVGNWSSFLKWAEKSYVRFVGSSYLLSTEELSSAISPRRGRIYVYGSYVVPTCSRSDDLNPRVIKLLYAGIIDREKRGAFNALAAVKHLGNNYELHIAGFGAVEELLQEINASNVDNQCKVFYDGHLVGEEFRRYCRNFHIGLSTQSLAGTYVNSSFPSKILTYLSVGLRVVSPYISCVAHSRIGHLVKYYERDESKEIASAICSINLQERFDCTEELINLDNLFCKELRVMFVHEEN